MTKVYIGCGAGFSGDRFDAAVPVVATLSALDGERFLIYEVLAERTLAIAQKLKRDNPEQGYSPFLDAVFAAGARRLRAQRHPHRHQHGRG